MTPYIYKLNNWLIWLSCDQFQRIGPKLLDRCYADENERSISNAIVIGVTINKTMKIFARTIDFVEDIFLTLILFV